jgi:hypothetical protein
MAFAYPPNASPSAERSEQLARLAYELLDAHSDTERLVHEWPPELQWRAHLGYLRDLQRLGREVLASDMGEGPMNEQVWPAPGGKGRGARTPTSSLRWRCS